MKLRYRILGILAIVVTLAFVSLAIALSYTSPCGGPATLPAGSESMKGIVAHCYGGPEVLKLEQLAKPTPADDQLLVKVHAASLNPVDWHSMRGSPYIMRLTSGLGVAEGLARRRRLRGHGRSRRQECHALQAGRRGVRRRGRRCRGIRSRTREPRGRTETRQHDLRAGRVGRSRCNHGTARASRQGRHQTRPEGADQRRVGWRGNVRRADREALRRGSYRRVQHSQRRAGALARRRPRDRLHQGRLRQGRRSLRHHPGQRRQSLALRSAQRAHANRPPRHRRRRQGRLDRAAGASPQGGHACSRSSTRSSACSSRVSSRATCSSSAS